MRVADYIFKTLADMGVKHVFMVSGGGAMHLNDALGREERIKYICNANEQGCAVAAEGYARASGSLSVINVTTGPGGTNAITGVIGSWLDSIPVLVISGQVKFQTTIASAPELDLRQLGDQEINIIDIVKPVTKYAKMVTKAKDIRKELLKAVHLASSGRPGPVWLDIPLDIQASPVDIADLDDFVIEDDAPNPDRSKVDEAVESLLAAKRPLIIAGHGIRLSKAKADFLELAAKLKIPVVTTFNGFDLVESAHPLFIGRIGTIGTRPGNFALQSADLVLSIGSRNNIRQVSYNWENFAPKAKKIVVDIDPAELKKKTVVPDIPVNMDAKAFIKALLASGIFDKLPDWTKWLEWNRERKRRYPAVLPEYKDVATGIQPYYFTEILTSMLDDDAIVCCTNATPSITLFQAGIVKTSQRIFANSGCAAMGFGLPAAVGAASAFPNRQIICLEGDGSLLMNIQEMQTSAHYNMPIKMFLFDNNEYCSIRQTHDSFFGGRHTGVNSESGVSFPDWQYIAKAFGWEYLKITEQNKMAEQIKEVLSSDRNILCDVVLCKNYIFQPKLSSKKLADGSMMSKPLEDMFPFLEQKELESNIIREGDAFED
jgi:acetolactate synthase-1/2/3 large subunit